MSGRILLQIASPKQSDEPTFFLQLVSTKKCILTARAFMFMVEI
jgi:hypothetical protein